LIAGLAALEPNGDPDLGRVAGRGARVRLYRDLLEQLSDIWLRNMVRLELGWLDIAIKDRNRLR
jgi:hypothetical protein